MKRSRIFLTVLAVISVLAVVLPCSGCDGTVKHENVSVSTVAELKAASGKDRNITLGADIDCGNGLIEQISCHGFDGNGYTISNAVVNGSSFFAANEFIKNVTLDGIEVVSQSGNSAAFVVGDIKEYLYEDGSGQMFGSTTYRYGINIENVHVKNSTLTVKTSNGVSVGGIFGYENSDSVFQNKGQKTGNVISRCSVTDSTFDVRTEADGAYVGGIYGEETFAKWDWHDVTVSDCFVSDCDFYVNRGAYVGGLFGRVHGTFERCYSKNNNITVEYTDVSGGNMFVPASGRGYIYAGGVFGSIQEGSTVRLCYAEDNFMTAYSSGRYRLGGLGGFVDGKSTVNQCYALDTGVIAGGRYEKDVTTSLRHFGGLIGYADGGGITSCFAAGVNHITDNDKPSNKVGEERNYGGFIGGVGKSVTVQYCAACGLSADDTAITDGFCPTAIGGLIDSCYADGAYGNVNECDTIAEDDWLTPSKIKTMLSLFDSAWSLQAGKLPRLEFGS